MYENNYDYMNNPEDSVRSKKRSHVGKTLTMLLAIAVVGGASGYGGAYLQNNITASSIAATDSNSEKTVLNSNSPAGETAVKTLLSSNTDSDVLTTKQIVEKVSPSVVSIHSSFNTQGGTSTSTGTGIVLSNEGYIITNAHVVQTEVSEYIPSNNRDYMDPFEGSEDIFSYFFGSSGFKGSYQSKLEKADSVTVILSTDDETEYEAEIIGADEDSDLAVLKIKEADNLTLTPAEFGDSNLLTMGDKAVAIGYPMGLGLSTSEGIVSGLNRTLDVELSSGGTASMTLIQTDAAINPGNSGGPLINEYGQIIGITSSKLVDSSVEGLGFAIPITDAMPLISDLMNKGYVTNTTPQIGITGTEINNAVKRYYGLPVDKGVLVVSVSKGSGAEAAGICAGDVIIGVEGKEITSMDELTSAKKGKSVGNELTVTLARADGNIDVTITLGNEDSNQLTDNTTESDLGQLD